MRRIRMLINQLHGVCGWSVAMLLCLSFPRLAAPTRMYYRLLDVPWLMEFVFLIQR